MAPVQLYVYDLSRGMAKQMSLALTGKQIDGIWHTSVVVFGREIFYGQGILESRPGATHHGQPVQVLDMGETQIDVETFNEYLESLAALYTAEAYHLIEFNCNNFTADVVGFLTGRETPKWITGLPAEFLATPFGQMLKPQIDSMFRSRSSSEHRVNPGFGSATPATDTPPRGATPSGGVANGASNPLLSSIAAAATSAPSTSSPLAGPSSASTSSAPVTSAASSPLTLVTSSTNFQSLLKSHHLVVNFTNTPGCPPCRVIKPIYEALAAEYAPQYSSRSPGLRFVEVELGVGEGRGIASRYGVSATPTFMFFRDGAKVDELRGAGKRELESRIEAFVEDTWPRHVHRKAYMPAIEGLPVSAITSSAIPNYTALLSKLESFLAGRGKEELDALKSKVVPLLEGKGDASTFGAWVQATSGLLGILKAEESFPVLDLWRIGVLQPGIAAQLASSPSLSPIDSIISTGASTLSSQGTSTSKPYLLTLLRLLTNLFASLPLANLLLVAPHLPSIVTITVDSLLHADTPVRSAAAGLAVNLANYRHRLAKSVGVQPEEMDEAEWETELLTALVEAIQRETDEDVGHRLLVAVAQCMYLNKGIEGMKEVMEVLDAKAAIEGKTKVWKKKEVRKLMDESVVKLL